jgi:uncharacterized membrane protein
MEQKQWQYGLNIFAGLMLFFLPWLLRFEDVIPVRSWDFFVIGVAVVGFGALALHMRSRTAGWASLILGIWMFFSPWVLGFVQNDSARNGALMLGALVFLVSLWAKLERTSGGRVSSRTAGDRS